MAVVKVEKNTSFTTMSNVHLRDKTLSLKAIGLMSKMLSLPEDWDYSVRGLESICLESKNTISSALKELENAGYLIREQSHGESGKFAGYDYTLYESPFTKNPSTEKPLTVFSPQINKELTKDLNNKPPKAPQGARRAKAQPEWDPGGFENLWRVYPRGEDRPGAVKEWDALKPDRALQEQIMQNLKWRDRHDDLWSRGIGIPYFCRYLKYRRWEDETRRAAPMSTGGWAYDPEVGA